MTTKPSAANAVEKCPFLAAHAAHKTPLRTGECPAFDNGCPFKTKAPAEWAELVKKCPAFAAGCPFRADTTAEAFAAHLQRAVAGGAHARCPAFEGGRCPFAVLVSGMEAHVAKCPVFAHGCPYKTPTDTATPIPFAKCPAFAKGCPFVAKAPAEWAELVKKCPAFAAGCPFRADTTAEAFAAHLQRAVEGGAHARCPAFEGGRCPFAVLVSGMEAHVAKCSLFSQGCPYASKDSAPVAEPSAAKCPIPDLPAEWRQAAKQCPAFAKGCPFRADTSAEALKEHLERMLQTGVHDQCPAFAEGCPFARLLPTMENAGVRQALAAFEKPSEHHTAA